jgi:soluble lytic murein transglycosylase-like protein
MQVNLHVWRGVYDPEALVANVGYNVRAGNEILVHYLVDYALRKGEHERSADPDGLARAAYAAYNGGPSHLARYRRPNTPASLKMIDNAFLDKYRAIQAEGAAAVKRCLLG